MGRPEQSSEIPKWLRDSARTRKLSEEEEQALFEVLWRGKSASILLREIQAETAPDTAALAALQRDVAAGEKARADLLEHTSWVVRSSVKRITDAMPAVSFSDLFGVGLRALDLAIEKFDPGHHATLATYAWENIQHSLRAEVREIRPGLRLSDHAERILRRLKRARRRLLQELDREPSIAEFAQAAGCSKEQAEDIWMATQVVSLTGASGENASESIGLRPRESVPGRRADRALDRKIFLERLEAFLTVRLASASILTQEERRTAQALAKRFHRQLAEEGEASRPKSAIEWRILIRALASGYGEPSPVALAEGLTSSLGKLSEVLQLRERRLDLVRALRVQWQARTEPQKDESCIPLSRADCKGDLYA